MLNIIKIIYFVLAFIFASAAVFCLVSIIEPRDLKEGEIDQISQLPTELLQFILVVLIVSIGYAMIKDFRKSLKEKINLK